MASEILRRVASSVILVLIVILCVMMGYAYICGMLIISTTIMIYEWSNMNASPSSHPTLCKWGYLYIIAPHFFWIVLLYFIPECKSHLLLIFVIVWSTDIFAYFGGRLLKGPRLAPTISPKKTWSGAVVGSIMAISTSYLYIYLAQHSVSFLNVLFSSVITIASIVGDLVESKVKRILRIKDSGSVIPGHGGVCDRMDSFLMATYAYALLQLTFSTFVLRSH
jgi:phosphatidate cytidylyltransferase